MPLLRRLGLLVAVGLGAAVLAGPALGARPVGLNNTVGTANFLVHYQTDPLVPAAATQDNALSVALFAERALAAELADGYSLPASDLGLGGDNRIDVYIADLTSSGALGLASADGNGVQSSGYIRLAGNNPAKAFTQHVVAHELFHLIQFGTWANGGATDSWIYEATSEWMGYRASGYDTAGGLSLGPYWLTLDCSDPASKAGCNLSDTYVNGGYTRWTFFQYLAENYGYSVVRTIFSNAATLGTGATAALGATLAAAGTTLAAAYNNWATNVMTGGFAPDVLRSPRPTPDATISAGTKTGSFMSRIVPVNHLSTSYLAITRGGGSTDLCYQATMSLSVTIPAGTLSRPAFYWDVPGSTPVPLFVSGNTATATVPWDTCTWSGRTGYLALPNASTTVDAADFKVSGTISVDTSRQTTATPPPPLVALTGVVAVPSAPAAPSITIFGPELLKLQSDDRQLRLIVQSDGEGALQATLGSIVLGSQTLRGGNNDLRFALPRGLRSLRRAAAAGMTLTLTPLSAGGAATGAAVTRSVSIAPPRAAPTPKKTRP